MMLNIFSSFDPMWFNMCYKTLIPIMTLLVTVLNMLWLQYNKLMMILMPMMSYISQQFMNTNMKWFKTMFMFLMSTFFLILSMNMMGMLPYTFSTTSHIMFTTSLAFPLWQSMILSSILLNMKQTIAHLLPESSPLWLGPFLVLVELISILMRPLTLSFRLAANMTAGHVVLSLILASTSSSFKMFLLTTSLSTMYVVFELIICIIQAYVFCLLISLYSNDHAK